MIYFRHANIPAFGGILPLFTLFPAIPRGNHNIPLLQLLSNVLIDQTAALPASIQMNGETA